jgi:hypothetical protein
MFVWWTNGSVADLAGAGAVGHEAHETSADNTDDLVSGSGVVLDKIDKRTVLVRGEGKKAALVTSGAHTGEDAR